ncbi:hypothetical protein [Nitrosococcus wardiae]|uniref:Uncharacterized protein n=1 Tax=Nitrosococcus wardiae TaxID=1814290 RepID=A0A4P7BY32_9GAMM|nr:hypothetical protein [Nitrosococcus wardiae]QBQ55093.1 hypothetical protein E3U44_11655 [Nitrosococcus wardiae]
MLLSSMAEIIRGIGLIIGLAVSFFIVPATAALLDTISPSEDVGSSIYVYKDVKRKMVLIVGSSGTCASSPEYQGLGNLSDQGAVPLLTQMTTGQFEVNSEKLFKSHCQMNYDVQVITFEDAKSSSFPPDPIDRSFDIPAGPSPEGYQNEGLRNL